MSHLKLALETLCADELETMPLEEEMYELVTVSRKFEKRMKSLLRSGQQARSKLRVGRMLLVAILVALMTSAMSIQAFREPIAGFLLDIYEYCTDLIFQGETADRQEEREFVIPNAPDGYTEINREEYQALVSAEYYSERGHTVSYTQYRQEGSSLSVDTEDADAGIEEILGFQVFLYSNKGWNSMIWSDGEFVYELNADCGMPELRSIVETFMGELS